MFMYFLLLHWVPATWRGRAQTSMRGRTSLRETSHHTGAAADLPVQSLNDIVGTDASPVFAGKIAVGKRLLNAIFHLLSGLLQLMERSSSTTAFAFSLAALLLS